MCNNFNNELRMTILLSFMFLMFVSCESAANIGDDKTVTASSTLPESQPESHKIGKRAWQQLQAGWGKRNSDDSQLDDSELEELRNRMFLRMLEEQLLANKVDDGNDFLSDEDDAQVDKRAWNQMGTAWGKRDWSQMRSSGWGKRQANDWNNMRGLWGKRSAGWNKLSSAWGK